MDAARSDSVSPKVRSDKHSILKRSFCSAVGLAFVGALAAMLTGCGAGTTVLPSGLQPSGTGLVSITTTTLPDAIVGLSYTANVQLAQATSLINCSVTAGALPNGISLNPVAQGTTCLLSTPTGGTVQSASGVYPVTIQAKNTTHSDSHSFTITVRAAVTPLAVTPIAGDAIVGRSYTNTVSFTVPTNLGPSPPTTPAGTPIPTGNGPITSCTLTIPSELQMASFTSPSPNCVPNKDGNSVTYQLSAAAGKIPASDGGQTFSDLSLSVTLSPIKVGAVVAVPAQTFTETLSLTVRKEFVVNNEALADGVQGRSYGNGAPSVAPQPATTSASSAPLPTTSEVTEFGNGPLTNCAFGSITPSNPGLTISLDSANPNQCLIQSTSPLGASGSYDVTVAAKDSPVLSASGSVIVPANTALGTLTLVIHPEITYSANPDLNPDQSSVGILPDAVNGRTYGEAASGKQSLVFTAQGGLLQPVTPTTNPGLILTASSGLPKPLSCPASGTLQTAAAGQSSVTLTCDSGTQPVNDAVSAGSTSSSSSQTRTTPYSFTVSVSDKGSSVVPPKTITIDTNQHTSYQMNVHDKLGNTLTQVTSTGTPVVTATNPGALLDGVMNRTYGVGGGTPVYTATGGLDASAAGGGGYIWCVSQGALPGGFAGPNNGNTCSTATTLAQTTSGNNVTLQASQAATQAVSNTSFTVLLDDTGNQAVPTGTASGTTAPNTTSITVRGPLTPTLSQQQAAGATSVSMAYPGSLNLLDGILDRSYGAIGGTPAYTVTGGLGSSTVGESPYRWCLKSGTLPAGMTLTAISAPVPPPIPPAPTGNVLTTTCSATGSAQGNSVILQTPSAAVVGGNAGTYSWALQVDDGGNAAVPSSFADTTSSMSATANVVIHPQIPSVTTNDGPNMVGVQGRSYGVNAKFSGLVNLTYTVPKVAGLIPGVGPTPASTVSPVSLTVSKMPNGILCSMPNPQPDATQPQTDCNSVSASLPTTAATSTLSVTASDLGNLAVPGGSTTTSDTLSVVSALQVPALTQATNPTPTTWFPGVSNRSYGTIGAPPTYTASGGLGAVTGSASKYTWCVSPNSSALPGGLGGIVPAIDCGLSSTTTGPTATLTSSSLSSVSPQKVYGNILIELDDTGNLAVPDSHSAGASTTSIAASITVNPALSLTAPSSFFPAVAGRSYGFASTGCSPNPQCAPAVYTPAGGLGGYTPGPIVAGPLSCTLSSGTNTYACSSPSVSGTTGEVLSLTVSDTANSATPSGSVTNNQLGLTINPEMTFTAPVPTGTLATAVTGRSYGSALSGCSGGTCAPVTYTIASGSGLPPYNPTANGFTSDFTCTHPSQSSTTFSCSSADVLEAAAITNLSATFSDTGNQATPQGTIKSTQFAQTASIPVNGEMMLTPPSGSLATAVTGRTYGAGTGCPSGTSACAPVQFAITGGLGNYQTGTLAGNPGPDSLSCPVAGGTYSCSTGTGGHIGGTSSPESLLMSAAENGNASTPGKTITNNSVSLSISPEMTLTPPSGSLPTAVTGRTYAAGTGCPSGTTACTPVQFGIAGGLGNYQAGTLAGNPGPDSLSCSVASGTYSCSTGTSGSIAGTSSPESLLMTASENGNTSTPAKSITNSSKSLAINPEMTLTPPSGSLPTAVTGRTYGAGTGCPSGTTACTPVQFGISGGLGNYQAGTLAGNPGPDSLSCSVASGTYSCSTGTSGSIAGTSSPESLLMTASENGNTSTPAKSITNSSKSLAINPEMTLTPPSGSLPTAVTGRTYGAGTGCPSGTTACTPVQFGISGGLGNYQAGTLAGNPGPDSLSCSVASGTYSCSTGTSGSIAGTSSPESLLMSAPENGNASTPAKTITNSSKSLPINPKMVLTPVGSPNIAILGRSYGQGSACAPGGATACATLNYTIAGGLGNYLSPGGITYNTTGTFSCPLSNTTYQCSTASVVGLGSEPLTMTATETGNGSTPGGTATDASNTLTVDAVLSACVSQNGSSCPGPPVPVFDGVDGRTYGVISGNGSLNYSASGGLGSGTYLWCTGALGGGFASTPLISTSTSCTVATASAADSFKLTASPASGASPTFASVRLGDTGNASVPNGFTAGSSTAPSVTVTLDPEITIDNLFIENGTEGEPYGAILSCIIPGSSPGACGGTGNPGNAAATYTWSLVSGGINGVSFVPPPFSSIDSAQLGYYQGVPTLSGNGGNPTSMSATFQVADDGNPATPSCTNVSPASTCPELATSAKIFKRLGYVATYASGGTEQGDTLVEYNTDATPFGQFGPGMIPLNPVGTAANPVQPRVTSDGQYVYVTEQGDTHDVGVVDSVAAAVGLSGAVVTSIPVTNASGTFNPTPVDITPQMYSTSGPPFITFNGWLGDPTINDPNSAAIEGVQNAECPVLSLPQCPAASVVPTPLPTFTLPDTNLVAASTDGTRLFVSFSPEQTGPPVASFGAVNITNIPIAASPVTLNIGSNANAVLVDPRGDVAYVTREDTSSNFNISVISTITATDKYSEVNTIPPGGGNICSDNSLAGIAISPDATRLYAVCVTDNNVHVYDVSGADPTAPTYGTQITMIDLTSGPSGYTPCSVAIDPKVNASNTFLFVSCQNSDTISVVSINSDGTYTVTASITTDNPSNPQTCGAGGSCPQVQDMVINPGIHITTGGDLAPSAVPATVIPLPEATHGQFYSTYVVAAGGTVSNGVPATATRTWSEPTLLLGVASTPCEGLSLNAATGEVSGTPTTAGTCGVSGSTTGFVIRVTDASAPPQFVERQFQIVVK